MLIASCSSYVNLLELCARSSKKYTHFTLPNFFFQFFVYISSSFAELIFTLVQKVGIINNSILARIVTFVTVLIQNTNIHLDYDLLQYAVCMLYTFIAKIPQ